jgi:hypothetical protein
MLSIMTILLALALAAVVILKTSIPSGPRSGWIGFSELWRWQGVVDRRNYIVVGLIGFAIKHNIDRISAGALFGRGFTPWNYWIPPVDAIRINSLSVEDARFLVTMVVLSLPFVWVGLSMTIRRLRSAALPPWLAVFFFVPIGNLLFFLLLSLFPERSEAIDQGRSHASPLGSVIPRGKMGSAGLAVGVIGLIGVPATYLSVQGLGVYGWGIFVALPFCFGLLSVLVYGYHERRTLRSCLAVSAISVGIVAVALLAFAIEGVICILMALPIALPMALLGGVIGYLTQCPQPRWGQAPPTMLMLVLLPFGVMTSESIKPPETPRHEVRTSIRIEASPEKIWKNLIAFPAIDQQPALLFKAGISYPIHAEIRGEGIGAIRECLFSTGTFVERIDLWEENKRFAFTVVSGPEGMRELSPYDIHPRHLDGYFVPESAEFRLTPNPDGSTQLEGVSIYRNSMWPAAYWGLWSERVIHQVHGRVFNHVKALSEDL